MISKQKTFKRLNSLYCSVCDYICIYIHDSFQEFLCIRASDLCQFLVWKLPSGKNDAFTCRKEQLLLGRCLLKYRYEYERLGEGNLAFVYLLQPL